MRVSVEQDPVNQLNTLPVRKTKLILMRWRAACIRLKNLKLNSTHSATGCSEDGLRVSPARIKKPPQMHRPLRRTRMWTCSQTLLARPASKHVPNKTLKTNSPKLALQTLSASKGVHLRLNSAQRPEASSLAPPNVAALRTFWSLLELLEAIWGI